MSAGQAGGVATLPLTAPFGPWLIVAPLSRCRGPGAECRLSHGWRSHVCESRCAWCPASTGSCFQTLLAPLTASCCASLPSGPAPAASRTAGPSGTPPRLPEPVFLPSRLPLRFLPGVILQWLSQDRRVGGWAFLRCRVADGVFIPPSPGLVLGWLHNSRLETSLGGPRPSPTVPRPPLTLVCSGCCHSSSRITIPPSLSPGSGGRNSDIMPAPFRGWGQMNSMPFFLFLGVFLRPDRPAASPHACVCVQMLPLKKYFF